MNDEVIEKLLKSSCQEDVLLAVEFIIKEHGKIKADRILNDKYSNIRRGSRNSARWMHTEEYKVFAGYCLFIFRLKK